MNIGVTSDQDIAIVDANLSLVTGLEEIQQLVQQRLLSFRGDWFLDLQLGMPYFQEILRKETTLSGVELAYLDTISRVPGILSIDTFELIPDAANRIANIKFTATTTNGVLNFNTGETT